ncbi:TonB-dependent receptor [Cecembia sp.]|uniref:TonB-dependent receptor n=1 Tax=Cecembia sp. TaxID=1898110 RepID=UPI0025C58DC4|nr:TonB-dependent receptor [Cecembia sp.]
MAQRLILYFFFILLLIPFHENAGQSISFSLSGRVVDEQEAPLQAIVSIHELGKSVIPNENGFFEFQDLKPGNYHVHVTHIGFKSFSKTIHILNGDFFLEVGLVESEILLNSMTVEANPFKNGPLEQSQTILILDRDFIQKNNGGTFANAIEKLPGISTINTGVGISKPVIRGMSFNRIMINDRGIKQEGQQWGADHGLEIDPFDVDRVEIIKGPASLIYGSDGMAGVINIAPAAFKQNGEIEGHYSGMYRSNNDMISHSIFVDGNQDDFVFRARFTAQDFSDYRVPAQNFIYAGFLLPIFENRLKNTAGKERHFSFTGGVQKKWGYSTLTVSGFNQQAGIFAGAVGIPNSYNLRHDGDHRNIDIPRQDNQHYKVIWNNNIQFGKFWMELDLGYQRNQRKEFSFPHTQGVGPNNFGNLALSLNLDVLTANLRLNQQHGENGQSILGFNLQHSLNQHRGFEFLLPNFQSIMGGIFYFREQRLSENLVWNGGIRADGAAHDIEEHLQPIYVRFQPTGEFDQRNPDIKRNFLNMSGSTGLSWVIKENLNVKFNIGSAYRIPTPIELASNGVHHGNFRHEIGNSELLAERSYQADLNLALSKKKLYVSFSPFFGYFDNFIYLAPAPRFSPLPGSSLLWEYRQNNAIFTGGEIMMQLAITKGLNLSIGAEYVHNLNLDTGLPLPLTPPFSTLTGLEYKIPKFSNSIENLYLFVESRWAAAQNRVDRNERITEGFQIWEAGLGWDLQIWENSLQLQLSGQNLTNAIYFNHLSRYRLLNLPEQGRNISFSINIPIGIR